MVAPQNRLAGAGRAHGGCRWFLLPARGGIPFGGQVQGDSAAQYSVRRVPRVWAAGTGPVGTSIARGLAGRAAWISGPAGAGGGAPLGGLERLARVDEGGGAGAERGDGAADNTSRWL